MTAPTPSPAASPPAVVDDVVDVRADRTWSLRVYGVVVLSFLLWVALLIVLQGTFS